MNSSILANNCGWLQTCTTIISFLCKPCFLKEILACWSVYFSIIHKRTSDGDWQEKRHDSDGKCAREEHYNEDGTIKWYATYAESGTWTCYNPDGTPQWHERRSKMTDQIRIYAACVCKTEPVCANNEDSLYLVNFRDNQACILPDISCFGNLKALFDKFRDI